MTEASTDLAVRAPRMPTAQDMAASVRYAENLAASGLLPAAYRKQPANVLYAIEYGRMVGLTPMAAITGVHVIEGKPSASAALISALVRRAGHKLRVRGDAKAAWCQIIRSDDPEFPFEVTYTIEDAATAKLLGKSVWQQYPASMLKARAISQCARDACEEALFGLHYTAEELGADVDDEGEPVAAPLEATAPQLTKLAILCKEKRGVDDRAARLAVVCEVIGREIASSKELTSAEASRAIEALGAEPDFIADAETVPDAPPQMQDRLIALLEQRLDLTDHDDRMAWITGELNRHVATAADLTLPEATGLIERLEATEPPVQPWDNQPQVPPAEGADAAAQAKAAVQQESAQQRDGSWSHQMLADRGAPLTTKADGSDQMFEDMAIAIADATDPNELEGLYLAAKHAHELGKLTAAQFGKLDQLGRAQNEDLRAKAAATEGAS